MWMGIETWNIPSINGNEHDLEKEFKQTGLAVLPTTEKKKKEKEVN